MNQGKEFLRQKLIQFQTRIADLNHLLAEDRNSFQEKALHLGLLDIVDAFESIGEVIESKKDGFDKSARILSKNIRSIHKKLIRLMKSDDIVQMEFPDNTARMDYCRIVDTCAEPEMENQIILTVIKKGYISRKTGAFFGKPE
jgi:molecular chaperone GrpE (heat shock protein)